MAVDVKRFNWRAFFSLYVVISFVVMALTGLVLFVAPPGRVANWAEWTLGGPDEDPVAGAAHHVHDVLRGGGGFHVYFNWNILVSYLKNRLHQGIPRKRELAWSAAAAVVLATLTLGQVPPVGYLMDASETASASWSSPTTEPPVPHAELLTLAKLAETVKVPGRHVPREARRGRHLRRGARRDARRDRRGARPDAGRALRDVDGGRGDAARSPSPRAAGTARRACGR